MTGVPRPRRQQSPVTLQSAGDLDDYLTRRRWLTQHGPFSVDLPDGDSARLAKRLNFWRTVCGCLPGGLLVLGMLIWRGVVLSGSRDWSPGTIAIEATSILALGIAVKFAAILFARLALCFEIVRLRWRFRADGYGLQE